jgi:hypothetical protein
MSEPYTFRWRSITFTTTDENFDHWTSGPWSIHRSSVDGVVLWTARWTHNTYEYSAYDEKRPWDRLAALDALLDALKPQSIKYWRELGDAWQQVRSLESQLHLHRVLQKDILEVEKTRAGKKTVQLLEDPASGLLQDIRPEDPVAHLQETRRKS